jgi:hypothetical protein
MIYDKYRGKNAGPQCDLDMLRPIRITIEQFSVIKLEATRALQISITVLTLVW